MNPLTQSKNATILPLLIALALGWLALSPKARAQCPQLCDNNTAVGLNACTNVTTGAFNTARGFRVVRMNSSGDVKTGSFALDKPTPEEIERRKNLR